MVDTSISREGRPLSVSDHNRVELGERDWASGGRISSIGESKDADWESWDASAEERYATEANKAACQIYTKIRTQWIEVDETLPQYYTDPVILSPPHLKPHLSVDPSPDSDNQKTLSLNAAPPSSIGDNGPWVCIILKTCAWRACHDRKIADGINGLPSNMWGSSCNGKNRSRRLRLARVWCDRLSYSVEAELLLIVGAGQKSRGTREWSHLPPSQQTKYLKGLPLLCLL